MIRFGFFLLVSAVVLASLTLLAWHKLWISELPSFFYQTLIFLVFTTATIFVYLYKVNKPGFFIQLYLLTMVVKFIAYGAYNLLMILEDRTGASLNVIFFMLLYVVFTALEIAFLYRKISDPEQPQNGPKIF